jgi:hypothetical protein
MVENGSDPPLTDEYRMNEEPISETVFLMGVRSFLDLLKRIKRSKAQLLKHPKVR